MASESEFRASALAPDPMLPSGNMKKTLLIALLPLSAMASIPQEQLIQAGAQVNTTLMQHTIRQTDRSWDLAIAGYGFFPLLDTKTGQTLYTRQGRFEMDHEGWIVLESQPHLRLIVQTGSQMGPINFAKAALMNGMMPAGMTIDDEADIGKTYGGVYAIYPRKRAWAKS